MQRERLICWLSFSLVLLVFLNMMLFYKLWMLEYSAQSLTTWQGLRLHERYTHTHTQSAHTPFTFLAPIYTKLIYYREPYLTDILENDLIYRCRNEWSFAGVIWRSHTNTRIQLQTCTCTWTLGNMHTKLYPYDCVLTQLTVFPSKLPQTQMEWAQLLEAQQRYHDAELQKWREIIKSSVVLLDQVQQRICLLLFGVMGRQCMCNFV